MMTSEEVLRAAVAAREEEVRRLLVEKAARRLNHGRAPRRWRWHIEPGMETAFEHLRSWLLSSQREAPIEVAAPTQGAAQGKEAARRHPAPAATPS